MTLGVEDQEALAALESRLRTVLPEEYQDCYDEVLPVSMGSAGLKYGGDGKIAWNEMWATFCDLAMAGGPPHKGTLLEPGALVEIDANTGRYQEVVEEIVRGVRLVTGLAAQASSLTGWVRVECHSDAMAGWLLRAIVMENVSARCEGSALDLPAGPGYRVEKEIKNVVTVIAKTCHYWTGHMWRAQKREIAELFMKMADVSPLVEPELRRADSADSADSYEVLSARMAASIHQNTGLTRSRHRYAGWLGLDCTGVATAIWMMRALVASNILSRREDTTLFVPVNPATDGTGDIVVRAVARIHRLVEGR
jgi:sirohydrochlorin cobaltochelatase